jgi:hypothetical protein
LVEHKLPKLGVAGSNPVSRSTEKQGDPQPKQAEKAIASTVEKRGHFVGNVGSVA